MGAAIDIPQQTEAELVARARELCENGSLQDLRRLASGLDQGAEEALSTARTLHAMSQIDARRLGAVVAKLAQRLADEDERIATLCGETLVTLTEVIPAKVAKHSEALKATWADATPAGRDGIVRTFAGLCQASVVYQRRLSGALEAALREADDAQLLAWGGTLLPLLKGEPYATAREIVEQRLAHLPREEGQSACADLGVDYRGRPPSAS